MSQVPLSRSGILAFMDDESRHQLSGYGKMVTTTPGQVLIKEGEINTNLYIVLYGSFKITTQADGAAVDLDTVGPGDCLGEVAIFNPDRASATVRSVNSGQLWRIDVDALQKFLLDWPAAGCAALLGINIILSRRLKHANEVVRYHEIVPGFLSVRSRKSGPLPK
jgi:CRP/FNR family cyclic AMP-dependent transcriptional regulator